MDASTFLGNKIIDHIFRNQAYTPPAAVYLSAHTADPGLTGASEVGTAGSNGYNRQSVSLAAAANKATSNSGTIQITMPSTLVAGTAVPFLGLWDAATGGNFLGRIPLLGTNFETTVVASTDLFTAPGSAFSAGDAVVFEAGNFGPGLPAGLVASTIYYVSTVALTTAAFKVADTSAHAQAGTNTTDVTADGECIVRKLSVQTFNANNILQVAASALSIAF